MTRSLPMPALLAVVLTGFLLAAPAAHAGEFARAWHQPNLTFASVAGNLDGDAQDELLFYANLDQQLVLVDGLTGNVEANLTGFKHGESGTIFENIDGDSRLELLLIRPGGGPTSPLTKILDWTPGGYVTLFSHSEPVSVVGYCHLRSESQFELLEISDTDVRVRDMSGNVLLRASTAVSPWTGAEVSAFSLDMDGDGTDELGVTQHLFSNDTHTQFFNWNGAFVPTWSSTSWFLTSGVNTDGDPQVELFGWNKIDGHYALFDGLTGATDLSLPEFTHGQNARVNAFDIDGDGRHEIFASRSSSPGVTPLTRAYKWVTGNYVQMFSDTEDAVSGLPVSTRATGQFEFYEETATDAVLRDLSGVVLFRASSAIPGWSGSNMRVATVDLTHDGIAELLIQDDNTVRVVRHVSGNYVQLWSSAAWQQLGPAPRTDANTNEALLASSNSDGHFALLDPLTGAVRAEFPLFSIDNSGFTSLDFDHDGLQELLFWRLPGETPLSICYRWNGSSYAQLYSHQDEPGGYAPGAYRNSGASELLEQTQDDLRLRASNGALLFLASTDISGWTGVGTTAASFDVDHDGVHEFLASDAGGARLMRWTGLLDVEDGRELAAPVLLTSSPNPFRTATSLQFSTRNEGTVGIAIYDAGGRLVRRLDQRLPAGTHAVKWDGRDAQGHAAPNGVLFYEVRADGVKQTRKMVHIGD